MWNISLRRVAPRAHARLSGLAVCVWMAWVPALAAEAVPPGEAAANPFKQYRNWRDEPLDDWRQANERVGEIGGWRTYLREAQQGGDRPDSEPGPHSHHEH